MLRKVIYMSIQPSKGGDNANHGTTVPLTYKTSGIQNPSLALVSCLAFLDWSDFRKGNNLIHEFFITEDKCMQLLYRQMLTV